MSRQPRVLFVSLFNDVGSDRIVAAMGRLGAECGVMGSPDAFAARSRFAANFFKLPSQGGYWARSLFLGARLARVARTWQPDLVVPLDEFSARTLRDPRLYRRARPRVRALLERSLGASDHFETICDRHRLVDMACEIGIDTPSQRAVDTIEDAAAVAAEFGYPVVLKREQTCGGAGVTIVDDAVGLAEAHRRAAIKAKSKRWMQRVLGLSASRQSPLVLQRHVPGPMAFRVVACARGEVLDGISFLSECAHPAVTGASTILRPIERPDMDAATRRLVAALGCSGLVSLDFILAPDGPAVLIEMNARPVASGHLGRLYGHDVYAALLERCAGLPAKPAPVPVDPPTVVALFPRELDRDPWSRAAETAGMLHDVPENDPGAVTAYAAWLEARHPHDRARLREVLGLPDEAIPTTRTAAPTRRLARAAGLVEHLLGKYMSHPRGPASAK